MCENVIILENLGCEFMIITKVPIFAIKRAYSLEFFGK